MISRLLWYLRRPQRALLAGTLRSVADSLAELCRSTEHDFLRVGGKLEEITRSARAEADTLASLGGEVGGERGELLAAALREVSAWAAGAGRTADSNARFRELERSVRAVESPLAELKDAVRTLGVMGIVAAMESARLGERAAGFGALAGEVGGLAASIEQSADGMVETSRSLRNLLGESRERAAALAEQQASELVRTTARCADGLEVLRAEQQRIAGVSHEAREGYQRVAAAIVEVVGALQFHDATRQRLEHVAAELVQTAGDLDLPGGSPARVSSKMLELQAAQLSEAARSFGDCVAKIREDLGGMNRGVAGFANLARELLGHGGAEGRSTASDADVPFLAVESALAAWISSRRALAAAAATVSQACTRMHGYVAEIEGVGVRLLWLALNAEIQAVHLAGSGAVMGAVAEGIRGIAQHASTNASSVGSMLREIDAQAGHLASEFGEDTAASADVASMAGRIRGLASDLRSWSAESGRLVGAIAAGGDVLAGEIAATSLSITAHREMAEVSSACLESLRQAASTAILVPSDRTAEMSEAREKYTMHAEREVHDSFAGRETPGAGSPVAAAVETREPAGEGSPAPAAVETSEFGDNVELF